MKKIWKDYANHSLSDWYEIHFNNDKFIIPIGTAEDFTLTHKLALSIKQPKDFFISFTFMGNCKVL